MTRSFPSQSQPDGIHPLLAQLAPMLASQPAAVVETPDDEVLWIQQVEKRMRVGWIGESYVGDFVSIYGGVWADLQLSYHTPADLAVPSDKLRSRESLSNGEWGDIFQVRAKVGEDSVIWEDSFWSPPSVIAEARSARRAKTLISPILSSGALEHLDELFTRYYTEVKSVRLCESVS